MNRLPVFVISLLVVSLVSCNRRTEQVSGTDTRLSRLGLMYSKYAGQHNGKPPASMNDLRGYIQRSIKPEELATLGVASLDDLFVSPRDGQPYKLIPLARLPPLAARHPGPVVVYEQQGLDGKRLVAFLGGRTEEVDADRFQQLVPQPTN